MLELQPDRKVKEGFRGRTAFLYPERTLRIAAGHCLLEGSLEATVSPQSSRGYGDAFLWSVLRTTDCKALGSDKWRRIP